MDGTNWYLQALREGIHPGNEANTSRYVHEVLLRCLDWPFEAILPQASKRGFIDYQLQLRNPPASVYVEVKPFGATLREEQIRKYIVQRGPSNEFRVGVLTNFQRWEIYVAGRSVKAIAGDAMTCVREIDVTGRAGINDLASLIGHRGNGQMKAIRAALAETDNVIGHLVVNDPEVVKTVRRVLGDIRDRHELDAPVPQHAAMSGYLGRLLAVGQEGVDDPLLESGFSKAKIRQAVCSLEVAEATNARLIKLFDARTRAGTVRNAIARLFRA